MTLINERIRYSSVRVVDDQNNQLGVMETKDALDLARSRDLDLILVADKAQPPVCRIMNYGKFKYEKSKRDKGNKGARATELKMVRLHPRTGVHDRQILERHAEKFLRSGHKVRVVCQFRGRENAHPQIGRAQLDAVAATLEEVATVEGTIMKQGRDMTMFMVPKPGVKPIPKVVKEGGKNQSKVGAIPEIEDIDDELEEYSAPGVVDDHDDDEIESELDEAEIGAETEIAESIAVETTKSKAIKNRAAQPEGFDDESEIFNNVQQHKGR